MTFLHSNIPYYQTGIVEYCESYPWPYEKPCVATGGKCQKPFDYDGYYMYYPCCKSCDVYRRYQDEQAQKKQQTKNGAFVHMKSGVVDGTKIIDSISLQTTKQQNVDNQNDILMNVKQDEKSKKFSVVLMSNGISDISSNSDMPVEVTRVVEVPVEVIKEVEVSVDMTDEVQKEQLQTLKSINSQLSSIQDDVEDAKCKDVLLSILQQLSSMTYLSSMCEIKGQLSSVIANNHAVRIING